MEYVEMVKQIDKLQTKITCLSVSLSRAKAEREKFKVAFDGAVFCNKTLQQEIETLKEENEDLRSQIELRFKEGLNG